MSSEEFEEIQEGRQYFARTEQVKDGLELLQDAYDSQFHFREPKGLAITGRTGAGKSTLAEFFIKDYPQVRDKYGLTVPILRTVVPSEATVQKTILNLLIALGETDITNLREEILMARLFKLIKECSVRMIILDEFQHLVYLKDFSIISGVTDWLKNLIVDLKIPLVIMGMPSCLRVLEVDKQLGERISMRLELFYISHTTPEARREYKKIMQTFEARYDHKKATLTDSEMLLRFLCASQGSLRKITDILNYDRMKRWSETDVSLEERLSKSFLRMIGLSEAVPVDPFKCAMSELRYAKSNG
jgi:Cdc6-like AAA superfamily ATPase